MDVTDFDQIGDRSATAATAATAEREIAASDVSSDAVTAIAFLNSSLIEASKRRRLIGEFQVTGLDAALNSGNASDNANHTITMTPPPQAIARNCANDDVVMSGDAEIASVSDVTAAAIGTLGLREVEGYSAMSSVNSSVISDFESLFSQQTGSAIARWFVIAAAVVFHLCACM